MIVYVDTSTLIKLLIEEDGTEEAAALWDAASALATAVLTHVEARAALAAAHRQRRITARELQQAVGLLEQLWSQLGVVGVDEELVRAAGGLAAEHALRGYDAVHLAAASAIGADVVSSADRRLCEVASRIGFHVADPTSPPPR